MNTEIPYYYELRFRLLAFDQGNNTHIESHAEQYFDKNLSLARQKVFEDFEEYLSYPASQGRLKKDRRGNFIITQPLPIANLLVRKDDEDYPEWSKRFSRYKESISIWLVFTDEHLAEEVTDHQNIDFGANGMPPVEMEYLLHMVNSYGYDDQRMIDNLEMRELALYNLLKIDTLSIRQVVFNFGEDYADSGENIESGARREILSTPHIWSPIEEYNEWRLERAAESEYYPTTHEDDQLNLAAIIANGESNQVEFKPCLLYNFKTNAPGISIKYIIAKAICGFLNANGGAVFIGISDKGKVQGIDFDYSLFEDENKKDKLLLEVDSLLTHFFGIVVKPNIDVSIETIDNKDILIIGVSNSRTPVFLHNKRDGQMQKEFYVRMSASTRQIQDIEEIVNYIFNKDWR